MLLAFAAFALAQDPPDADQDYLNLSFVGQGATPTTLELLEGTRAREVQGLRGGVGASQKGEASYSLAVPTPPGVVTAPLSVAYTGGGVSWVGRGFQLVGTPSMTRVKGRNLVGAYADVDDPILIQGAGLDGLLSADGAGWRWSSTEAGELHATWSAVEDTWTIEREGRIWTFAPANGAASANAWHPVHVEDVAGNAVDWVWTDERLDQVSWGGNTSTLDLPNVVVDFEYGPATSVTRTASEGWISVIDSRLDGIVVSASGADALRWELVYDTSEGEDRLVEIYATDPQSAASRTLGTFAWTAWTGEAVALDVDNLPDRLLDCKTYGGLTQCGGGLYDMSGDGLLDVVNGSTAGWFLWDAVGDPTWEAGDGMTHSLENAAGYFTSTSSVVIFAENVYLAPKTTGSYQTERMVDLDGDGLQDRLTSAWVPAYVEEFAEGDKQLENEDDGAFTWTVHYGMQGLAHGYGSPVVVPAPFKWPQIGRNFGFEEVPVAQLAASYPLEGSVVDLYDMNGDGWTDVVEGSTGSIRVWLAIPVRGMGFEAQPIQWLVDPTMAVQSLESQIGYTLAEDIAILPDYVQSTPRIDHTEVIRGLRDINTDGLLDWVEAEDQGDAGNWRVWLNNGASFEAAPLLWPAPVPWLSYTVEAIPQVRSCSFNPDTIDVMMPGPELPVSEDIELVETKVGSDCSTAIAPSDGFQGVLSTLLDADGDGQADMVDASAGLWWRNVGDRFEAGSRALPSWFPEAIDQVLGEQTVVSSGVIGDYGEGGSAAIAYRAGLLRVADIDGDSLLDVVHLESLLNTDVLAPYEDTGWRGTGTRTGLLSQIVVGTGAVTQIDWVSSALMFPSGTTSGGHEQRGNRPVVGQLTVLDPVTDRAALQWFDYADGVTELGQWLGFTERSVTQQIFDGGTWYELDGRWYPTSGEWHTLSETATIFELDREGALPLSAEILTDHAHAWLPSGVGPPDLQPRMETTWTYEEQGPAAPWSRRATRIERLERAEVPNGGTRLDAVDVIWDADGYPTSILRDGPDPHDDVEVEVTWTATTAGTSKVATRQTTTAFDPDSGANATVEDITFAYDGLAVGQVADGLSSGQLVCPGPVSALCGETLQWDWYRNLRGVIDERQEPGGESWTALTMAWGNTIPTSTSNTLGHVSTVVLDGQGRVAEQVDPNGVEAHTLSDAFGRPTAEFRAGAGGSLLQTHSHVYHDDVVPSWVQTTSYTYATPLSAATTVVSYQVLDGFGDVVQTWTPDETDVAWVVSESEKDVAGNLVLTRLPHRETLFDATYTDRGAELGRTWFDPFGEARYTLEEVAATALPSTTDIPAPGVRVSVDPEGWYSIRTSDIHGRMITVEEGYGAGAPELVGTYTWDGRGRLARFEDAKGGEWRYHYDGAGRLRSTSRVGASGLDTPYLSVEYDGPRPLREYELTGASPKEVVRFSWDLAGREVQRQVWDDLTSLWQTTTTEWDSAWVGAKTSITDPSGKVTWQYVPGAFGGFGRPSHARRTFTTQPVVPEFRWTYDFAGNEVTKVWPGGETVQQTWSAGGRLLTAGVQGGASAAFQWDQWGLPAGFQTSVPDVWSTITRSSPSRLQKHDFGYVLPAGVPDVHTLSWGHLQNGMLDWKSTSLVGPFFYEYDFHKRITELNHQGVTPQERYTYDAVGNLTTSWRNDIGGTDWAYTATPQFSEMPGRSQTNGPNAWADAQTWDGQGRMSSWVTRVNNVVRQSRAYTYDGSGRLRRQASTAAAGVTTTTFDYDSSDVAAVERTTSPGGATTTRLRFLDWELDVTTGVVLEPLLPMLRRHGAHHRWVMLEPDGHAHLILDLSGKILRSEIIGVQGKPVVGFSSSGAIFPMDGQHGDRPNHATGLIARGVRTTLLRDGTWLQPEPFLRYGPQHIATMNPRLTQGVYAGGNTNLYRDTNGYMPWAAVGVAWEAVEIPVTVASIGIGVVSAGVNSLMGNTAAAKTDLALAGVDALTLSNPAPGVASIGRALGKGAVAAGNLAQAAIGVVGKVDDAASGIAKTVKVPSAKYPESAAHIADAQAAGKPSVVTIERSGADANRAAAIGGTPKVPGKQLDEYPAAMFKEGGDGASVRAIDPADNMGAGACIGNQCRGLPDGAKVKIEVE